MEVECTGCGTRMSRSRGAGNDYFTCPRCGRTIASLYAEAIRRGAGARPAPREPSAADRRFEEVKARMAAWNARLDAADPYLVLGVPPGAPLDRVRSAYREAALRHHPDRGGDVREMRRITRAWETIRARAGVAAAPVRTGSPALAAAATAAAHRGLAR